MCSFVCNRVGIECNLPAELEARSRSVVNASLYIMRGVDDNYLVPQLDLRGKKNADTERDDGGQRVLVNTAASVVHHAE